VLAADVTSLRNRGLAFAFTSSPYMITAFAGSKAAEGFLNNVNWRWGFGAFAIIVPAMTLPLFVLLKIKLRQAEREGRYVKEKSGRSFLQRFWHGVVAFDCEFSSYPLRKTTNGMAQCLVCFFLRLA
jgi:MFS family permease